MDQTPTDACYRCGYNLTGIADDQACPECGLLAERSRRVTDELHQTRPRWLRRLSWGVWLIVLALLLPVPLQFATQIAVERWLSRGGGFLGSIRFVMVLDLLIALLFVVPVVLLSVGVLLLASREGYPPADRGDARLRFLLRLSLAGPWAAVALLHAMIYLAFAGGTSGLTGNPAEAMKWAALAAATLGSVPLVILLALRLRGLARRARSAHLAEHCLIVGIGTAATLIYVFAAVIVNEYAESWGWGTNWTGTGTPSLLVAVVLATLCILFVLWALYLLVRFAVAFGLAYRRLRRQWRRDDRAAGTVPGPALVPPQA